MFLIAKAASEIVQNIIICAASLFPSILSGHFSAYDKASSQVYIGGSIGNAIGYANSYGTLGGVFTTSGRDKRAYTFVDLRGHGFSNGKWASNAGIGFRSFSSNFMMGANAFYDYRKDKGSFNQVGVGFEMLATKFALRINGYMPIAKTESKTKNQYSYPGGYEVFCTSKQRALPGIDAEFGWTSSPFGLPTDQDGLIGLGGYYYRHRCQKDVVGGRMRLGASYQNFLYVELVGTTDSVFGNNLQGVIAFSFPFDRTGAGVKAWGVFGQEKRRGIGSVQRQETIVLGPSACSWTANY